MKKLFAIFLVVFALGACSSSDDGNNNSNSQITPPAWIQGTWKVDPQDSGAFKFTNNDFCQISSFQHYCWKSAIETANPTSPSEQYKLSVVQEISDSRYLIIMDSGVQNIRLEFQKISDNKILWVNSPYNVDELRELAIYTKQ